MRIQVIILTNYVKGIVIFKNAEKNNFQWNYKPFICPDVN